MSLTFQALPFANTRKPSRVLPTCTTEGVRARRLSLPTFRERRFLADNYIEREKGRAKHFARATAFNFSAWPLIVRELSPEEQRRKEGWYRRYQTHQNAKANLEGLAAKPTHLSTSFEEEIELPLVDHADSLLLHEIEANEMTEMNGYLHFIQSPEIPPWAYIVRVRAGKQVIGKRAVQRNRAKRRIRAAASQIFPDHACRGREYVFAANPEALTIDFADLVDEVIDALKKTNCWEEEMTEEMLRRERYVKKLR